MSDEEVILYNQDTKRAAEEVRILKQNLQKLKECIKSRTPGLYEDENIRKLLLENTKLKHRLTILKTAQKKLQTSKISTDKITRMQSILKTLKTLFTTAITTSFPDLPETPIDIALAGNNPKFGDYQCNSALPIAQQYKQLGKKVNPQELAKQIVSNTPAHDLIGRLEVAGPGFINIFLSKTYIIKNLHTIFDGGIKLPDCKKQRIVLDFSSPNIAKEMHVGHLRSTIIGESIGRLLEFFGHDVLRINHVGDWGTQFGMLIAHLQDKFPKYVTQSPPIHHLQDFYKESKQRFDTDEDFKKRAYECVVKLQSFEPDYIKAWQLICDVSRKEFQKIYDRLDITLTERGESFYAKRMDEIVKELTEKNLLEEDEGRKILWGTNKDSIPLTVVKSDGGYTYDTSDLAALKQRVVEEKADWLIYVTDVGQSTHFQVLFDCSRRIGLLPEGVRVDHVAFGVVLGEDKKKFKTRSGDTVKLQELLDEGLKRALDKLVEKGRDQVLSREELKMAQESVAYGCIKYADLSHNRNHDYVFSFDKMLEDKGNTAVYLLYAYTRIKSIARTAQLDEQKLKEIAKNHQISLEHEKELKLGKVLFRFPDVLDKITKDLCLHHLCEYIYEISVVFTEFYDNCYCIERDSSGDIVKVNYDRILLVEATAIIMKKCFDIVGLKPVSRM